GLASLRPDLAALCLHEAARDREAQAGSAAGGGACGVAAPEAVEDPRLCVGRNPLAAVLDRDADAVRLRLEDDGDGPVRRRVAQRVRQQVEEDALDLLWCAGHRGRRHVDAPLEPYVPRA